jgi:hypothetical protein
MDVTSLSSADFYQIFQDSNDQPYKFSTTGSMDEDDEATHNYRAWLVVAYCALLTVGILGNVWVASVISCVLKASNRQFGVLGHQVTEAPKAIQIYILTLCCSDLIVLGFLLFLIADLIYGHWILPLNTGMCRLYLCTESLNKFCGPFLLVALSGYCYISVCKRHWKTGLSGLSSNFICAVIIGICFALVLLLITPVYIYGDVQFIIVHNASAIYSVTPKCALQPPENVLAAFTIYSFICGYVIPAFLFTFFYASILKCAYKQVRNGVTQRKRGTWQPPNGDRTGGSQDQVNRKGKWKRRSYLSRVVKTSMGLVLFYLICWTPYWTLCLHQYLTPHQNMHESNVGVVFGYLIHMLPYINCSGYPILYTVLNKTIKDAYKRTRRSSSSQCNKHLLYQQPNEKNLGSEMGKRPSCLIEMSLAISTSFASNSQLANHCNVVKPA